ncbi:hypothetical protein [Bacillus sp. B-jedd]|uniref:hypothetical protein n=1 Tax=Bacillus sp. B-jedd TaxID=1476857 RepID=UPI0005156008|nr:hypothetical protein [Bacillus sp. B-jedd]CEG26094.1 hypothetical protein BN1002_00933 [Bacillus sp. B-jedd]
MDNNSNSADRNGQDPLSRMMFGKRESGEAGMSSNAPQSPPAGFNPDQAQINYILLMEVIDGLADIADKLKPVFADIYPYIQQAIKKK